MYRCEHPKPQFMRESWINLNGEWQFEIDRGNSGKARRLYEDSVKLSGVINVPFCPQSKLSGVEDKDFMSSVWYKREVELTEEQVSGKVNLHFGAVDYRAEVYVNGQYVGSHKGGYVSFKFDITKYVHAGKNTICLHAEDDERDRMIPRGKQSEEYYSHGCDYTRTTGIWQTVWMEFAPVTYIEKVKYLTDAEAGTLTVIADLKGAGELTAAASFEGKDCGTVSVKSYGGQVVLTLAVTEKHLWEVGKGGLYDLVLTYGGDVVNSYFGLRSIDYRDWKFYLNGKSVFQRLVLDQGFNPEGIYTAPSDEFLAADIDLSMAMGFNGARLHEKVFEARFLYHADKMGYLVFGEYPNWRLDHHLPEAAAIYMNEWQEAVERDFNSPAVIGWCPLNETWGYHEEQSSNRLISSVYYLTKRLDPTRPCIDVSGNFHVTPEVYDIHDYDQNTATFRARWEKFSCVANAQRNVLEANDPFFRDPAVTHQNRHGSVPFFSQPYHGEPIFVSEYGGIQWNTNGNSGWGYGVAPKDEREFIERYRGLTAALLDNPDISGFCYTQLYDIEQEINGLYTYAREPKFSIDVFREINQAKAAIED